MTGFQPIQKRQMWSLLVLLTFLMLAGGLYGLPISMRHLKEHRDWIKSVRARIRGAQFAGEIGVVMQMRGNDCGAACLKMVLADRGVERSVQDLALDLETTAKGTSMLNLRLVAGRLGLPARSWALCTSDLRQIPLPAIACIYGNHFVVIRRFVATEVLEVDDPALGRLRWPVRSFQKAWAGQALIFDRAWSPS